MRNKKGYTLVEILLSIALLSIIIIPLLQFFIKSAEVENLTRRELKAAFLAEKYLEQYKNHTVTGSNQTINETEEGYDIIITFNDITSTLDASSSDSISFGNDVNPGDAEYTIDMLKSSFVYLDAKKGNITFFDTSFSSSTDDEFLLTMTKDSSNYKLLVQKKDGTGFVGSNSTTKSLSDTTLDMYVNNINLDVSDNTTLYIKNESDMDLNIYEFSDVNKNITIKDVSSYSGKDVEIISLSYNDVDKGSDINIDKLYRLTVDVTRDGDLIERVETLIRQ